MREIKYSTVQNWYPGDSEKARAASTISSPSAAIAAATLEDFLDPGRDRLGDHLEISELHPARRQFARRVLFDRDFERPPAGRFRHQDDPSRQEHDEPDHLQGHRAGVRRTPIAASSPRIARRPARATSPQCDSLLIGDKCGAHTVPYIEAKNSSALFEHEATTSKISEDQLFYCLQRGLSQEEAVGADRQRLRQGRAAATADGIRGRGAEASGNLTGRGGRMKHSTKVWLAMFAIAFGGVATAATAPAPAATVASSGDKCMDNAQSQAAMDGCAQQSLSAADKELNQVYQQVLAKIRIGQSVHGQVAHRAEGMGCVSRCGAGSALSRQRQKSAIRQCLSHVRQQ
jgi:hypothetical protein